MHWFWLRNEQLVHWQTDWDYIIFISSSVDISKLQIIFVNIHKILDHPNALNVVSGKHWVPLCQWLPYELQNFASKTCSQLEKCWVCRKLSWKCISCSATPCTTTCWLKMSAKMTFSAFGKRLVTFHFVSVSFFYRHLFLLEYQSVCLVSTIRRYSLSLGKVNRTIKHIMNLSRGVLEKRMNEWDVKHVYQNQIQGTICSFQIHTYI